MADLPGRLHRREQVAGLRYGHSRDLIDLGDRERVPMRALAEKFLELVDDGLTTSARARKSARIAQIFERAPARTASSARTTGRWTRPPRQEALFAVVDTWWPKRAGLVGGSKRGRLEIMSVTSQRRSPRSGRVEDQAKRIRARARSVLDHQRADDQNGPTRQNSRDRPTFPRCSTGH